MRKIWYFGDSFTDQYIFSNNTEYCNWKGYTPKVFSQILSEQLNIPIKNYAESYGMDNYTIFQTLCNVINQIESNDLVVIGWSEPIRFRLVDTITGKFRTLLPTGYSRLKKGLPYVNGVENHIVDAVFKNRENTIWLTEVNAWINLINKALNNTNVIHWSWYLNNRFQTITDETDSKIIDLHYSEKGNIDLANWILEQVKNGGYTKTPFLNSSIL